MSSGENYPRILLLGGEPMSSVTATGITLRNLFADYPPEKIATVFSTTNIAPDWNCAGYYFKINPLDVCGINRHGGVRSAPLCEAAAQPGMEGARKNPFRQLIRKGLLEVLEFFPMTESPEFKRWIHDFSPDVIYTLGAHTQIMRLATSISREHDLPVVLHFMDNWIDTRYAGKAHFLSRAVMLHAMRKLLERSSLFMTISPEMSEEYQRLFRLPGYPFMNCIPQRPYQPPNFPETRPLKIFYIGGLHLFRGQVIKDVASAIRAREDLAANFRITVFAPEKDWHDAENLHDDEIIAYGGNLSYSEVGVTASMADILLHVESFSPSCTEYTKLSISTKLVEYFMAGRPVLGVAPKHLASVKEIGRAGGVAAQSANEIQDALAQLMEFGTRQKCGEKIYEYAVKNHAAKSVRLAFLDVFQTAAAKGIPVGHPDLAQGIAGS